MKRNLFNHYTQVIAWITYFIGYILITYNYIITNNEKKITSNLQKCIIMITELKYLFELLIAI